MKIGTIKISNILTRKLIVLSITLLLLVSLVLLLTYKPISLPSAKHYIIASITKHMPQYQVGITEVKLYWDKDLHLPALVIKGVEIKDAEKTELSLEQVSILPSFSGLFSLPPKPPISIYLDKFEINLDALLSQKHNKPENLAIIIQEYIAKLKRLPAAKITLRQTSLIYNKHETKMHRLSLTTGRNFHLKIAPSAEDRFNTIDIKIDVNNNNLISLQGNLYNNSPIKAQLDYNKTSLNIDASCGSITIRNILNLWPQSLANGTREWLHSNLLEGNIEYANFNLQAAAEENEQIIKVNNVLAKLQIANATISYLNNAPPLKEVDAIVLLTADSAEIKAQKATLENIPIENLVANITNMGEKEAKLIIDSQINADLSSTVKLALMYASGKHPINTDEIHGTAATNIYFKISLTKPEEKELKVSSILKDVIINKIAGNHRIDKGDLVADYQNSTLTIKGSALIDETINADISYLIPADIKASQRTDIKCKVTSDMIKSLGFTPPSFLNKAIPVEYTRLEGAEGVQHFLSAHLDKFKFSNPMLKQANIDTKGGILKAEIEQTLDGDVILKNYELKTPGIFSKGSALLKKDYTVASIESEKTTMQGSNLSFSYQNTDYLRSLTLKGNSFDLSVLSLEELFKNKDINSKPFQLRSKLTKIIMYNGQVLSKPELSLNCSSSLCTDLKLKGNLASKGSLNISIHYPDFAFYSDNAGDSLRALNLYNNMHGGLLSATAKSSSAITKGNINIKDYYLVKTPILSKLLSITSLTTISFRGLADMIQGKGMNFKKLNCPITYNSGIFKLEDCMQEGTVMTMTGSGDINLPTQNIEVKGLIVPQNIINSIFKHLPIFNKVAGKKNGGFIAVSYNINGSLKNKVKISTNPLSILAPGFLKGLARKQNNS